MNRPIKFRAWNKKDSVPSSRMIYRVWVDANGFVCMPDGTWWEIPLMQFTGLLDKNGKEIYEGDIVVIPKKYPYFVPQESDKVDLNSYPDIKKGIPNYRGVVEWYYSAWNVSLVSVSKNNLGSATGSGLNEEGIEEGSKSKWEVIGNIYENPELLK